MMTSETPAEYTISIWLTGLLSPSSVAPTRAMPRSTVSGPRRNRAHQNVRIDPRVPSEMRPRNTRGCPCSSCLIAAQATLNGDTSIVSIPASRCSLSSRSRMAATMLSRLTLYAENATTMKVRRIPRQMAITRLVHSKWKVSVMPL